MSLAPSAPAHRVVDVVGALAAAPGVERSVSEIARAAGVNRTTCQSILLALEARGWVQRRGDAGWYLGAALIPLGDAALAGLDLADDARAEIEALVADLSLEALGSVVSGPDIVVVSHAHTGGLLAATVRLGQTIPFAPPFGIAHLVHAGTDAVDVWLDRAQGPLSVADRRAYRASIAAAEARGYVVVLDAEARRRFESTVAELAARPASRAARRTRDELVARLEREERSFVPWTAAGGAGVSQISATVFDHEARPVFAIGVHAQPHQIDPGRIPEYGARVAAAAAAITLRISGRSPGTARADQPKRSAISA